MVRVVTLLILLCGPALGNAAEKIDIGKRRQLLADDYVIDRIVGLSRVVQQPQRVSDRPVLQAEHPWEGSLLQMPCVLWDPQQRIYHMYYWAAPKDNIYTCYARSKDGRHWEKPLLGLHPGPDGSRKNNIVLRGEGKVARTRYVVLNPCQDDPARRFLALFIDNVPGLTEFAASSADGLHWNIDKKIGDLRHVRGGQVTPNPPFFLIEQQWSKDPGDGHRRRAIWRTESKDLKNWTGGRYVIEHLPDDDPNLEFYHACSHFQGSHTYHGLHFGYLYLFHTAADRAVRDDGVRMAGTIDTALMVSRDTLTWTRLDRSRRFFPLGPKGSWDGKMNFVSPEVVRGDEMLFYYSGWKKGHGVVDNEVAIGLAVLPRDRFVALQPVPQQGSLRGSLTTKPFRLVGEQLVVNANGTQGELRVAVLDQDGGVLAGFELSSCKPLRDDLLDGRVRWQRQSLKTLQGRTIRLKFELVKSRLFAFQVR